MDSGTWLQELRHSWPLLKPERSEVSALPLPVTLDSGAVRVGVDEHGRRHLFVPVGPSDSPRSDTVEGSLLVLVRTMSFAGVASRYVDISCSRADLFELFDDVLADVLSEIQSDTGRSAELAVEVVLRWRTLLATRAHRLLGLTAQMSLIAELHVLALTKSGPTLDVSAWRGPLREPHDILLTNCALEVKAVGHTSESVEIHGLAQLDPPARPLALVIVRMAETHQGERLPDVVARIASEADRKDELVKRLSAVGYAAVDAPRYEERFSVLSVEHVEVGPSVPRIVASSFTGGSVSQGIEAVRYNLRLDALDTMLVRGETLLRSWIEAA